MLDLRSIAGLLLAFATLTPQESPQVGAARAPDGVEIAYETAGQGAPTLVFVHGWSCDRSYWSAQVRHFAAAHRVVAVDLAGHGASGAGREEWTMAAFGADVVAVLAALDVRDAVLVGHSMGGPAIVEAARIAPERVAALVPVEAFHDVDDPVDPELLDGLLGGMRDDFPRATEAFVRNMFVRGSDPALVARIATDMASAPEAVALPALEQTLTYDGAAGLRAVHKPVRLIQSDLWPTDLAAARAVHPTLELAVIPRLGHFLMSEDPAEFDRALERAVRELTAR